jgi:hypothetical protein
VSIIRASTCRRSSARRPEKRAELPCPAAVDATVKKGVIVYHKALSDATGHFDFWKGRAFGGIETGMA